MESRNYAGVKVDVTVLTNELRDLFDRNGYAIRTRQEPSGIVLEATKTSMLRVWTGFSHSLTVRISTEPAGTRIWVGRQRWTEKIFVASAGLVLALVGLGIFLLILAALGAYWQYKITQDAWNVIEEHVAVQSVSSF